MHAEFISAVQNSAFIWKTKSSINDRKSLNCLRFSLKLLADIIKYYANKAKLEIFKFLRKSPESHIEKLANLCLLWKFNKYTLTRVFLHAEFISAMKTVQHPTVFMIENHTFLLIV